MSVTSLEFVTGLCVLAAVWPLLPGPGARRLLLAGCNAVFVATLVPDVVSLFAMAGFLLSGYGVSLWVRTRPTATRLVGWYFAILVATFLYLQRYAFLNLVLPTDIVRHSISVVGLSYMLFRQIHFVVDSLQGQIPHVTVWAYLNYQLNLFGLLAGPIQRFQDFVGFWTNPASTGFSGRHELLVTYARIFLGVIKLAGLSVLFHFAYEQFSERLVQVHSVGFRPGWLWVMFHFGVTFYAYPAHVYCNFSGYCDIVIGGARLIGLRMPENFDRPYLARNMIDYWNRWHKSLSFWIRDYIFTPLYKAIAYRWPRQASALAFLCYFVALLLAGVWHGSTWNWVVFGVLNGIGVSAAKLWENHLIKRGGRAGLNRYLRSPAIRRCAVFCNINFACVTILFFPADLEHSLAIITALFTPFQG